VLKADRRRPVQGRRGGQRRRQRHLWPRALLASFIDQVQLAPADERACAAYAESETHGGFEVVDVDFGVTQPSRRDERQDADEPGAPVP